MPKMLSPNNRNSARREQYEVLLSREEMHIANEFEKYFKVPLDNRDLNYDSYFEIGDESVSSVQDFNSNNTDQLDVRAVEDSQFGS